MLYVDLVILTFWVTIINLIHLTHNYFSSVQQYLVYPNYLLIKKGCLRLFLPELNTAAESDDWPCYHYQAYFDSKVPSTVICYFYNKKDASNEFLHLASQKLIFCLVY